MYKLPPFLKVLFFVDMFERIGYYGIRNLLVLFLISQFKYNDARAYEIFSVSGALLFMIPMLGSILVDRLLGIKLTLTLGGILIIIGQSTILYSIIDQNYFFLGLSIFMTGTGFFKPNLSNLLGSCYAKDDPNRTHGFVLLHVGVNIGSALTAIVCGYITYFYEWHYAFVFAALNSFMAIAIYLRYKYVFKEHGNSPQPQLLKKRYFGVSIFQLAFVIALAISFGVFKIIYFNLFNEQEFKLFGLLVLSLFLYFLFKSDNKRNLLAIAILTMCSALYFGICNQFSSVMILFAQRNVNKEIFGYQIPSLVLQAINPLTVIFFGLIIAMHKNIKKSNDLTPFILAICSTIFSLALLYIGCMNANENFQVHYFYLLFSIIIFSVGEIIVVPFMQSSIISLSPSNLRGFIIGLYTFFMAFSNIIGIYASKFLTVPLTNGVHDPAISLSIYSKGFFKVGLYNALIMCFLIPLILLFRKTINEPDKKLK